MNPNTILFIIVGLVIFSYILSIILYFITSRKVNSLNLDIPIIVGNINSLNSSVNSLVKSNLSFNMSPRKTVTIGIGQSFKLTTLIQGDQTVLFKIVYNNGSYLGYIDYTGDITSWGINKIATTVLWDKAGIDIDVDKAKANGDVKIINNNTSQIILKDLSYGYISFPSVVPR